MAEGSFYLARGLQLDPDYMGGGTFALLAKKGWGKTYAMRVMAAEFEKTGVPFVALDPMDAFWGLRSSKDGKPGGGLDIPIFGGEHADVPLEPTAGKLMADLVVEEGLSCVLSIAHFGSRSAERRFAMDFLDRLYRINRDLVHLLIDEADLFAPQKPQAGDAPLLGVTENIVRRGRNKGIGITLGTQRPAVLNKDVLTQVDGVIVGRMLGPQDRNAIDAWVGEHGDTKKGKAIKNELPDLGTGECWVWVPELGVLKKVKIREARTFDSSPTRKRGKKGARRSPSLADIDLGAIETKMSATIEKAKSEDPKELGKRIRELERQLTERPEAEPPEPVEVKVPVFPDEVRKRVLDILGRAEGEASAMEKSLREAAVAVEEYDLPDIPPAQDPPRRAVSRPAPAGPSRRLDRAASRESRPAVEASGDLQPSERKILDAIAWWASIGREEPTKQQAAFVAGYKAGRKIGGRLGNLFGTLRTAGLIDYPTNGYVVLTDAGAEHARPLDLEATTPALQAAIMEKLPPSESRLLQAVIEHYPAGVSKVEVAVEAGYTVPEGGKIGGRLGNLFGTLRSLGLIDYPGQGLVVAEPVLFLEGR